MPQSRERKHTKISRRQLLRGTAGMAAMGAAGAVPFNSIAYGRDEVSQPEAERGHGDSPYDMICELSRGPITDVIPELLEIVAEPGMHDYLIGLDGAMVAIASQHPQEPEKITPPQPTKREWSQIVQAINEVVDELVVESPADHRPSRSEVRQLKSDAQARVQQFLHVSPEKLEMISDLLVPLNLSVLPQISVVDDAFILVDARGENLIVQAPLPLINQDENKKVLKKMAIIAGMVLAIIGFLASLIQIKMPAVKPDKIVGPVSRAMRTAEVRTAFKTMVEILKREGATLGDKVGALFAFLKTLWSAGSLKEILKKVFESFSWFDLILTIAGIVAIFLTGGTSTVLKAAAAFATLALAIITLADAYDKAQQG